VKPHPVALGKAKAATALAILLIAALAAVPAVTARAAVIPLSWRDSGFDLAAGYRYTITLESGHVWNGETAKAAFDATIVKAELDGSHLKVWVNGDQVYDEDVGDESATLTLYIDCDGNGRVELSGSGVLGGFSLEESYRIMVYTETAHTWPQSVTSHVVISRQRLDCGGQTPTATPIGEPGHTADLAGALTAGARALAGLVLALFGIVILLVVLARSGGLKRLARRAVGAVGLAALAMGLVARADTGVYGSDAQPSVSWYIGGAVGIAIIILTIMLGGFLLILLVQTGKRRGWLSSSHSGKKG
jgi:hypothetical protein